MRIAAALLAALMLSGCAKNTPAEQPPALPAATVEPAAEAASPEVENNGGYYVRVGDSVCFRRYGADALPGTATYGDFAAAWSVDGESELVAYNTKTGALTTVCAESGAGPLWYGDGGFYLSERAGGESFVAWYALDGSRAESVGAGEVVGVTDSGLLAVSHSDWDEGGYRSVYSFYRGRSLVGEYTTDETLIAAGLTDDGLFLVGVPYPYEDALPAYGFLQITPQGEAIRLGELSGDEDAFCYDVQADRFLAADGKVVFGLGFYGGTGHFFDYGLFAEAEIGRVDSLRAVEESLDTSELYELPYPAPDGAGGVAYVEALPGALRGGGDENDSLELWEDGAWRALTESFAPRHADGWAAQRIVQHMDYVDGAAYVTMAVACASPADDIGWREAYTLASTRYLRIARDGTTTEMARVDCDAELFGFVWFVEGAGVALWQQLSSEDGEGWFDVPYAYALPIADDAYWDEDAFDGVTGLLPCDYGEDEAGDYGYPVPEVEAAGELCLALDGDGTVVALMRKDPAALLTIDFDVPQDELARAAATLPLERRESDEDTPFFWAALRSLEDGVRVRVERTPAQESVIEELAVFDGAFPVGEVVYDGVLERGAFVALRTSLPWYPELRVSVSKDGEWGAYVFGEDNYLRQEHGNGVHPRLTLAAYPNADAGNRSDESLLAALSGAWLHYGADGAADAALTIGADGTMALTCGAEQERYELTATPGRLYSDEWEAPDLLCLTTEDAAVTEALGFGPNVGDYGVELYRTEGEELLRLTQRNNGDGALGALLPDADGGWAYDFVFARSRGAGDTGARRCGVSFPAVVARYDRDSGLCWLREAEIAESEPSVGDVWRAKTDAPCLACPVTADAAAALSGARPMLLCRVTTGMDGAVARIEPIS